jgi:hypothetical protein
VKLERLPDVLGLQAGSLDDPSIYRPTMDVFTSTAQPWDYMNLTSKSILKARHCDCDIDFVQSGTGCTRERTGGTGAGCHPCDRDCLDGSVPPGHAHHTPYGMIGRVEETSASIEARCAPRLCPTAGACDETHVPTATKLPCYICSRPVMGWPGRAQRFNC